MATTRGRCTNTDYCTLASQRKTVDVPLDSSFICPECAAPLRASALEAEARPRRGGAIIAGVLMLLTGVGAAAYFAGGSSRTMTVASVPPPPAPPVPKVQPAATVAVPVPVPQPSRTVLFRMRGSNTIGAGLGPKLAAAFLADEGDSDVKVHPLAAADETEVTGLRGDAPATQGDLTSPAAEHVLALDGIAVIVHQSNPTGELSTGQLEGIFRGTITHWSQLGGPMAPIHLFARDDRSGTFDTFRSLVLDNAQLAQGTRRIEDSAELAADVAGDPAAIGFVGLPYVADAKTVAVSESGATPLVPNRLTVATEDYPLTRRLFLYTPTLHPNALAQRFVAFALSPPGQAVVDEVGFVPLTIETAAAEVPRAAPAKFRALAEAARRLSTAFRFRPNSADLDNRGLRDLDRLVDFMSMQHMHGDQLTLVGFADGLGSATSNMAMARRRAEAVAAQMAQRGLQVGNTMALWAALPVANNATEEGREKNRRVEVFLVGLGQRTDL